MKRKPQIIMSASVATVLAFTAFAQEAPEPGLDRAEDGRQRLAHPRADRLNGAAKASDLIGMEVKNYQDQKLGKVEDLAVDVESGRVIQVILSTGGFIGLGGKLTAVPPGALHHDVPQKVLHLDATKKKLKSAPDFEMSKWAESSDPEHLSGVYRHFGQETAFTFVQRDQTTDNQLNLTEGQRKPDGQRNADDQRATRKHQRDPNERQRIADGSPNTIFTSRADGTLDKNRIFSQGKANQSLIPASRLGQVQKASKLIGTPVKNLQNENLGDVKNLLVDVSSGRIVAVIISSGGFLRMGDELSAVPASVLRYITDRDMLKLDASKETLSNAPHFKADQWPDFNQPSYAGGVYRAYQVEPYFATDADNTRRNVRDRNEGTLTPLDQGNSQADVATTAQIRKDIIADKGMSVNARNVKIITQNGQVTLRGPVKTAEEKRLIGEIANRIARAGNVDNQLEVKLTTSNDN